MIPAYPSGPGAVGEAGKTSASAPARRSAIAISTATLRVCPSVVPYTTRIRVIVAALLEDAVIRDGQVVEQGRCHHDRRRERRSAFSSTGGAAG